MIPSKRQSVNTKDDLYVVFCDVFLYYFVSFYIVFVSFLRSFSQRLICVFPSLAIVLYSVIYKRTA